MKFVLIGLFLVLLVGVPTYLVARWALRRWRAHRLARAPWRVAVAPSRRGLEVVVGRGREQQLVALVDPDDPEELLEAQVRAEQLAATLNAGR